VQDNKLVLQTFARTQDAQGLCPITEASQCLDAKFTLHSDFAPWFFCRGGVLKRRPNDLQTIADCLGDGSRRLWVGCDGGNTCHAQDAVKAEMIGYHQLCVR
jgi:hypothetical protein